jgi:hypothetical protein
MHEGYNNCRVAEAYAHDFTVRFYVDLGGRTYDVTVDAFRDGYDVEVWDDNGKTVEADAFAGRLGFSSLHSFGEAMVDGFHLDGPVGFDLIIREEVGS